MTRDNVAFVYRDAREHIHGGEQAGVNRIRELPAHAANDLQQLALVDPEQHSIRGPCPKATRDS